MHRQRRLHHELNQANRQIARYMTMTESLAISHERNRMARELHDTLAHTLTSSTVQLQAATTLWETNPTKSRELVERSLTVNRASLDETRRALHDLRAAPLENLGLVLAIRELGEITARRTGSTIEMKLPEQLCVLPEAIEQTAYRVAQEALENVVRHARATHVTVQMGLVCDILSLSVDDNGLGFEAAEINEKQRFGIRGMRERIHALGGTLDVHSRPDVGTRVQFAIQVRE